MSYLINLLLPLALFALYAIYSLGNSMMRQCPISLCQHSLAQKKSCSCFHTGSPDQHMTLSSSVVCTFQLFYDKPKLPQLLNVTCNCNSINIQQLCEIRWVNIHRCRQNLENATLKDYNSAVIRRLPIVRTAQHH